MEREEYNFWISNLKNIGTRKIEMMLQFFGSAEEVYTASREALEEMKVGCLTGAGSRMFSNADIEAILSGRDERRVQESFARLKEKEISFVTREEAGYPDKLRQIYASPFGLYVKGSLPPEGVKCLAVVGARNCSQYGKEMARYLAGAAAKVGIAVISGLARGIDSFAHEGALAAGGKTYAVLGCGIDICYPRESLGIYMDMQKEGGVISEYPLGTQPLAYNFPMRNRIISGLGDAILVIEARARSGSLITVDMGLEQGKDIYALPGKATDALSEGCNNLIKMGAKLVTTPKDILEDLIPDYGNDDKRVENSCNIMNSAQEKVYSCLNMEPKHIEEISILTKLPMDLLMEQLLDLELRGLVKQSLKNYYCKSAIK